MASVTIREIEKSFGAVAVLKNISLDIKDGEFIVLVGPSGCGKSTLLRIIAGLEQQNAGSILIGGELVDARHPSRRDIAMVFQSYALYPNLTVEKNITVPLRMRRLNFAQRLPLISRWLPGTSGIVAGINRDVEETMDMLGIVHLRHRKPGQLSGGQRQRVAVGRAMVRHPQAFLMDEPLSNLDAELRVHMRAEIAELHCRLATTFIYVTHDQAEAMTMADRIAVMMDGELLQVDTPSQVYANPNHIRVAEFIGSPKINILPAQVSDSGAISIGSRPMPGLYSDAKDQEIQIGVRPEVVALGDLNADGLPCRIVHHENLGSEVYFHAELDTGSRIISRMGASALDWFHTGDQATVNLDTRKALLFDAAGRRIKDKIVTAA
ncbi:ABC transporter ATP-binding protein [Candidatus Spongiihabitans sp.]|uniref:ABC transporter ATP-binding protein n=1 Tax=Candidatus Spongiihabitans sp. TaxID=3101308 RepID=UPI003C6EEEFB